MLATITCAVVFIGILIFLAILWEVADLLKVNSELRESMNKGREVMANLENENNFFRRENKQLRDSVQSLSAQLMRLANQTSHRDNIDNNEGD